MDLASYHNIPNSSCSDSYIPSTQHLLAQLPGGGTVLVSVFGCLTLLMVAIFIDEGWYIKHHVRDGVVQAKLMWMRAIYPVFASTSFMSLIMPRSSVFSRFVSSSFLGMCMYQFYLLITTYFGGEEEMVMRLGVIHNHLLSLNTPPLCCCCYCLPKAKLNSRTMWRVKAGILQMAISRPIITFMEVALWANGDLVWGQLTASSPYLYLTILTSMSTVTAMYSLCVLCGVVCQPLSRYNLTAKRLSLQLVMVVSGFQGFLLTTPVSLGWLRHCYWHLHPRLFMAGIHHCLLILEMTVFSIIVRWFRKFAKHEDVQHEPLTEFA